MASDNDNGGVQRSLGRIEGTQDQILSELRQLRSDFNTHVQTDEEAFSAIEAERNKAKGAGWVILSLLTGLASLVGGAVVSALAGWLKIG